MCVPSTVTHVRAPRRKSALRHVIELTPQGTNAAFGARIADPRVNPMQGCADFTMHATTLSPSDGERDRVRGRLLPGRARRAARRSLRSLAAMHLQVAGGDCYGSDVQRVRRVVADQQQRVAQTIINPQIKPIHAMSLLADIFGMSKKVNCAIVGPVPRNPFERAGSLELDKVKRRFGRS